MRSMVTDGGDATTGDDAAGNVFAEVPGGAALIRHFGRIPDFDGDRILRLVLDRDRCSILHVHARVAAGDVEGAPAPERHAAVAFVLGEIVDLRLDQFHAWSQLDRLILRRAPAPPAHAERTGPRLASGDVELELVPRRSHGGPGLIRARSVEIEMEPGIPAWGFRHVSDDVWLPALVGRALADAWDPRAVGASGAGAVYDRYVPELVEMVRDAAVTEDALVAHLARIEVDTMGLTLSPAKRVRAALALLDLRDGRRPGAGRPVRQWFSADGSLCLRIVETRDGQYAHEQRAYRSGRNGERARWEDVRKGRSGLFMTAEAAEREARHLVCWMSNDASPRGAQAAVPARDRA